MALCPIAIVAGHPTCPAASVCPMEMLHGDAPKAPEVKAAPPNKTQGR